MTAEKPASILRRMVAPRTAGPEEVPITSSRAVRLAIKRAADRAHGLVLTVLGLEEETLALDAMSETLDDDHLLVGLERDGTLVGLAAIDLQFRAAVIEVQTMGQLQPIAANDRPATATDAILMTDVLAMFLHMLTETTHRTDLEGWSAGAQVGRRVTSVRAAGLALADVDYRLIRLSLDLGAGGRQGMLQILLPAGHADPAQAVPKPDTPDWQTAFRASLEEAQATLHADLHRFEMPLQTVEALHLGQVIPLPGCTVEGVQLRDVRGKIVGRARLGQFAGKRAIRIEPVRGITLQETGAVALTAAKKVPSPVPADTDGVDQAQM